MARRTLFAIAILAGVLAEPRAWGQGALPSGIPPLPTARTAAPDSIDELVRSSQSTQPGDADALARLDAERVKLWNGPDMQVARVWLRQYFTRAKAVTPQQAQDYLTQLEKLPVEQLKSWLERFQSERQLDAQRRAVVDRARQMRIDAALRAQQQTTQGYANINRGAGVASQTTVGVLNAQRQFASGMARQQAQNRDATVVANTPGSAFQTGPYYLAFPPYAPYYAAATNPFPDGINTADPREVRDAADIERSTRESR